MEDVEGKEGSGYTVVLGNFTEEPFNYDRLHYEVYRFLGYPIAFDNKAVDTRGKPLSSHKRALTDSLATKSKLDEISKRKFLYDSPIDALVYDVNAGFSGPIFGALVNEGDAHEEQIARLGTELLQRALITTVEMDLEKQKSESGSSLPPRQIMDYYESIKDKVRPLSEEGVLILMTNEVREYLEINPKLKPDPKPKD